MRADALARAADGPGWRRWARQVERSGFCSHPVRLRGRAYAVDVGSGEVRAEYGTDGEPDGSVLVACKDRRAAVCASCAEVYRRDTWHLVAAGLRGRELTEVRPGARGGVAGSVPASVGEHPAVFATFTAPGFGAVHGVRDGGVCRPGGRGRRCRHGMPVGCLARHGSDDVVVGQPLCVECYDYTGHVLWHSAVPELWRRTSIYVYRAAARLASERLGHRVTVRGVRDLLRVSYVKVAEWQRRAAVHLHVVVRLDGVEAGDREGVAPPPEWADAGLLEAAIREAAGRVELELPTVKGVPRIARWGGQLDVKPITDPLKTAAYVAKYATKTAGDTLAGLPPRRFGTGDLGWLERRGVSPHVRILAARCLLLSRRPECADLGLAKHAHTLGFRGHYSTRSRRYSVTLSALRAARRAWRATRAKHQDGREDPWAAAGNGDASTVLVGDWRYVGSGFARLADTAFADGLARDHARWRQITRETDPSDLAWSEATAWEQAA